MDPLDSTGGGLFDGAFGVFFALFGIVFVAILIFTVVVAVKRYSAVKRAGYDPLTVDAQLVTRAMDSELLRPADAATPAAGPAPRTIESRLAELDDLFARGVISADERAAARADILKG
ncbi:hypothetical protein [Microbacterium mangrovi]|uniref:hypothetical protein n=1 Tax=Microbacterium mangrovi TaxID=1348253 RepID=UPI00068D819C|nr:hypothetical protein [Microbacterium mangrovi]